MRMTDRDRVGAAFSVLADGLANPVDEVMRKAFGGRENWNELWAEADAQPGRRPMRYSKDDPQILLRAMTHREYGKKFGRMLKWHERAWASELIEARNRWAHNEPISHDDAIRTLDTIQRLLEAVGASRQAREVRRLRSAADRVLVGRPAQVGSDYQPRGFDAELEQLWADGGDRRIWLRGGPGLGKSYSARRVMEQAVLDQSADREALLIWVDTADSESVTRAFAVAMDQLRQFGVAQRAGSKAPAAAKARALLELLVTSSWRWLVVLDNADAGSLFDDGLIPTGANPNGRVLMTTRSRDARITSHGRTVRAGLFTPEEAEGYLRGEVHSAGSGSVPLAAIDRGTAAALASTVGHHPLALSVAASTIAANAMTVADWIEEFTATEVMDAAADEPDRGGYPHLIGSTWQVALGRASEGLPEGVVERAALVAAVQDPDGHPTWLWDRDAVAGWVGGGSALARNHGVPVAVQRLIDSGIVELRGGTWRDGRVAIHQLAARAVREWVAPAALAELTGILLEQWLLEVTSNPSAALPAVLHRSLRPIAALPDLAAPAEQTVRALLAYRQPTGSGATRKAAESIEPYLEMGGTTVRIEQARLLADVGDEEAALGRAAQARTAYSRAADLYRQLVQDRALDDSELAACLMRLGEVEAELGNPEHARASRQRAASLIERLADTASDTGTISRRLADLVTLHDLLGNQDRKARALARAEELLKSPPDDLPSSADEVTVWRSGYTWRTLADLMVQAGRPGAAKDCLARQSALYEQFPQHWSGTASDWAEAMQALALLHAEDGEWPEAERLLTRLTDVQQMPWTGSRSETVAEVSFEDSRRDALVLLASVQAHLGRSEDAERSLASAAEEYRDPPGDDEPSLEDILDSAPADARELWTEFLEHQKRFDRERLQLRLKAMNADAVQRSRWEDAAGLSGSLLDLTQQAADAAPGDADAEAKLADAHELRGVALHSLKAWDDAAGHFARVIGIRQMLADLDPGRADAQRHLARALFLHAACMRGAGQRQAAMDSLTRSISAYRRAAELTPNDGKTVRGLANALHGLADMQAKIGELDEALGSHEEAISILSRLADLTPDDQTAQIALADALKNLIATYLSHGRREAAVEPLRRAQAIYANVVARQAPGDDQTRKELARTHMALGWTLTETGTPEDAVAHSTEAVTAFRELADFAPDDREAQHDFAMALIALGNTHNANGQQQDAADCLSRSANILQLLADLDPAERPELLIQALNELARIQGDLGRTDEADEARARATVLNERYPDEDRSDDE